MSNEEIQTSRETRRRAVTAEPFSPNTLVGSWGLYSGDDVRTEQVLIVCEPQPGIYLTEVFDLVTDEPIKQELVTLETLLKGDDEIGCWTFFDSHRDVRIAYLAMMGVTRKQAKEVEDESEVEA